MAKAFIDAKLKNGYRSSGEEEEIDFGFTRKRRRNVFDLYQSKKENKDQSMRDENDFFHSVSFTFSDSDTPNSSRDLKNLWMVATSTKNKGFGIISRDQNVDRNLYHISNEIAFSSYILELEYGWDGEDAKVISREIYDSAIQFVRDYSRYIFIHLGVVIKSPEINPVRDGSIDLSWVTESARMLVNIKLYNDAIQAFFYGDHLNNKNPLKGSISANELEEALAVWMKKLV